MTGPRLLTFAEAVGEIARATSREIRYVPVSPSEYRTALLSHGLPEDFVAPLVDLFTTVLNGCNSYVTDGVQRALGRPPRDFTDYVRDAVASGALLVSARTHPGTP